MLAAATFVAVASSAAHADWIKSPGYEPAPAPLIDDLPRLPEAGAWRLHVDAMVGMQIANETSLSLDLRAQVLASRAFGVGSPRPYLGTGVTAGHALLQAGDRTTSLQDAGPLFEMGLRFVDGGRTDTRLFLNAALVVGRLGDDTMDRSPNGLRLAVGYNRVDRWDHKRRVYQRNDRNTTAAFYTLLPHHFELVYSTTADLPRHGFMLGWGI